MKALAAPSIDDITLDDLVTMNGWRTALLHGDATIEELFPEEKPPAERKTLDQRLEALGAKDAGGPPNPPEQGDGGGGSSNAPPPEPTGAPEARTAETGAPPSSSPLIEEPPPKPDSKNERRLALAAEGDLVAAKGAKALKNWLDDMGGDDSALVTISMTKKWSQAASAKP